MKYLIDASVIIAAAGAGSRARLGYNKILYSAEDKTVVRATAEKFFGFRKIIVACADADLPLMRDIFADMENVTVVIGGETRTQTVRNALRYAEGEITLVHDGARPFVSRELIEKCVTEALVNGSAVPCVSADCAIRSARGSVTEALDRKNIYFVQTPQAFETQALKEAYSSCLGDYADDAEVFEKSGRECHIVEGERTNVKLTYPDQFFNRFGMKIGTGYDVHRLVGGRKLVLGGVQIDYEKGLLGHSDADVLVHAVMDALLSAAGLPDIGVLFPDSDPQYEGISSMELLSRVMKAIHPIQIISLSAVIMAQRPKLSTIIPTIRQSLAAAMGIDKSKVNVSATTTENLGIVGDGEGIAAAAEVLVTL